MDSLTLTQTPPTHDELLKALLWTFSEGEVRQFVQLCQLAAELFPEELRKAFAVCLGSAALEERNDRAIKLSAQAMAKADDANGRAMRMLDGIQDAVSKLDAQIGAMFRRLETADKYTQALA